MIVDESAGLQMRIDRHGSDKHEVAPFQILTNSVRQSVGNRHFTVGVSLIDDGFAVCVAPEIIAEGSEFFANLLIAPGVVNDRPHLALRSQHTLRTEDLLNVILTVCGDLVKFKVLKALTEDFTLLHHKSP